MGVRVGVCVVILGVQLSQCHHSIGGGGIVLVSAGDILFRHGVMCQCANGGAGTVPVGGL